MRSLALTLLALVACGDDGVHHLADAPPGPIDAPIDAPTSGPVTLTVMQSGEPVVGVDVYFQTANSSLVAKVPTGADGKASAVMEPGGFVTAVKPFNTKRLGDELRTFAGVKPGDQLRLTLSPPSDGITVSFSVPLDGAALYYYVSSSCSGSAFLTAQNLDATGQAFMENCGGVADVLVYTQDGNGAPLGYFYKPGVTVTEGATITFTDAYTPIPDATFTYTNVPAVLTTAELQHAQATTRGRTYSEYVYVDLANGTGTTTTKVPAIAGAAAINRSSFYAWANKGSQSILTWGPHAASTTIDVGAALLPEYLTAPTYAAGTHSVTWTAGTATNTPDLVVGELSASRTDANDVTTYWSWTIAAPYSGTSIVIPTLPADAAQYNVLATDTTNIDQLITGKLPGGYDAVRANVLDSSGPEAFIAGASGQLVYELLQLETPVRKAPPARVHDRTWQLVAPRR